MKKEIWPQEDSTEPRLTWTDTSVEYETNSRATDLKLSISRLYDPLSPVIVSVCYSQICNLKDNSWLSHIAWVISPICKWPLPLSKTMKENFSRCVLRCWGCHWKTLRGRKDGLDSIGRMFLQFNSRWKIFPVYRTIQYLRTWRLKAGWFNVRSIKRHS